MARSLNKVMLIGNLGSDPDVRTVASGTKVAEFSVATSRQWNDRNGQQQEKTEWHRIVAWGYSADKDGLAGVAERYLHKGDRVYIEGQLEYRSYEDKEGVTKYITEIRANEMVMLSGKAGGAGGGGGYGGGSERPARSAAPAKQGGGRGQSGGAAKPQAGYDDFPTPDFPADDDLPF